MIIVFLDKPVANDEYTISYIYKNIEELNKDISDGGFGLEAGDSVFIVEMPDSKEYIYKATLVEKKTKK